ncbi:hypothetical protein SGFS_088880 [Streptomyces graminofaciens]|uniref:Secreted protein n=1 Tax=Streptomyces graminofaciens TaxID=68212 RepID=A0ABN5VVT3_9ACTN|nr:hypothetical protein [Streptomyces graminofaciens]BBC37594.1 hypothetical protein SGFS_088880 [Streptomyces graminofaciens]
MRLSHSFALVAVAVALAVSLPSEATPHARVEAEKLHARVEAGKPDPFGAACRTLVTGSEVTATCYNPYADTDHVRLHIECDRWWDIDSDGAPVEAGPARTVRLTGRCWKEVRSAWVSHQRMEA